MVDKPNVDYARAGTLMGVVQQITTVAPKHTNLLGAAMDELGEMEAACKDYHDAKAKEEAEAKAEREQAYQAQLKAQKDAEDAAHQPIPARDPALNQPRGNPDFTPGQPDPTTSPTGEYNPLRTSAEDDVILNSPGNDPVTAPVVRRG